jgi:hypothetical protein
LEVARCHTPTSANGMPNLKRTSLLTRDPKNKNGQRLLISAAALPGSPLSDRGHRCKFPAKVQPELLESPIVVPLITDDTPTPDSLTLGAGKWRTAPQSVALPAQ